MGSRPRPARWVAVLAALAAAGGAAVLWARARRRGASAACAARAAEGAGGRPAAPVLVLGLDGAGKTSVLRALAAGRSGARGAAATQGSHAVSVGSGRGRLELLEVGGGEALRSYWSLYLPRVPLLIYVVDAADRARLPLAKQLLHQLLQGQPSLPVVVLANKQDLEGACGVTDIHEALALSDVGDERKMFLIGTHVAEEGAEISSGMRDAKELITQLVLETQ